MGTPIIEPRNTGGRPSRQGATPTAEALRSIISASGEAVFLMAADGSVRYLSSIGLGQPTASSSSGDDELGHGLARARSDGELLHWVHREDRPEVMEVYRQAFSGVEGDRFSVTHRVVLDARRSAWVEARIVNQIGVPGVDALVVNIRDVTPRVAAERRLRRRLEAEDLLARIASRFVDVQAHQLDSALHETLAEIGEFCGVDRAWIFQFGPDRRTIDHTHEWCADGIPTEIDQLKGIRIDAFPGLAGWLGDAGPLIVDAVDELGPDFEAEREILAAQGIRSMAGFGMFVHGELYGIVGLDAVTERRRFATSDLWLLGSAANVFGAALRRCAVEDALARSEERFRAMIHHATDGVRVLDADLRTVYASPAVGAITGYTGLELAHPEDRLGRVHPDDRRAVARARANALANPGMPVTCAYRCRHHDGHWIDLEEVMTNLLHDPAVQGVVANMRDITAHRRHEAELLAQARRDPLTDLPNRRLLDELVDAALARVRRTHAQLALVYLDLDRFKLVNDSFGHHIGDALLVEAGDRLRAAVRGGDVVARLSGDEFVVLCEPVDGEGEALGVADRVLAAFREPFSVGHHTIYSTASVGVVVTRGEDHEDQASLLRDADAAMYSAKAGGRNRAAVFSGTLVAMARERLEVEVGLRSAVPERQLRLRYQPIVDLGSGRITGAEALLRWAHPDRGELSPDAFLDVAEETGMIVPIGEWVVTEACHQLARWAEDGVGDDLDLHVNVSVRQLVEGGIADVLARELAATGLAPERLCVEITESALLAGDDATSELSAVRACGVRLALDDFGTGHSSLSYLRRLDLDVLKIDRSFVDGVGEDDHDTAIVTAIVKLAEALGLSTVGEGIESEAQATALQRLGCEQGQGYWCSRAISPDDYADLVRGGHDCR